MCGKIVITNILFFKTINKLIQLYKPYTSRNIYLIFHVSFPAILLLPFAISNAKNNREHSLVKPVSIGKGMILIPTSNDYFCEQTISDFSSNNNNV